MSECGITVACTDDLYQIECDNLGGEWTEGLTCSDIVCGPVQWTVEEGGNGHWYQLIRSENEITSEEHFLLAESLGGHTACIHSAEENEACFSASGELSAFLGIRKIGNTNEGAWITGEPWNHSNWGETTKARTSGNATATSSAPRSRSCRPATMAGHRQYTLAATA